MRFTDSSRVTARDGLQLSRPAALGVTLVLVTVIAMIDFALAQWVSMSSTGLNERYDVARAKRFIPASPPRAR